MTRLLLVDSQQQGGQRAAAEIVRSLSPWQGNPRNDLVLGLATGSSPVTTWRALARHRLDLSRVRAFALDEYLDITAEHRQRYFNVIHRNITQPLGLNPHLVRVPGDDGAEADAPARYERLIQQAGKITLQVLGIGRNGHIGFNEPGTSLTSRCRIAALSEDTRRANARFFGSPQDVPRYCMTQGIGTILDAGSLLLLAYGPQKADALAAALEGPVTPRVPASALQLHPNVTVVADRLAAASLRFTQADREAAQL